MNVLKMKEMNVENKKIYDFFKQLNLEDVQKLVVEPDSLDSFHYSHFLFEIKDGTKVRFYYASNQQISSVGVIRSDGDFFPFFIGSDKNWLENIWDQFVDHFTLHIRLMFINKNMPWKWELEYVK